MSHPTWVRGLKPAKSATISAAPLSHPTWVRGLKQQEDVRVGDRSESHPTWVRGLKLVKIGKDLCAIKVAPYVGAWIETSAHTPLKAR